MTVGWFPVLVISPRDNMFWVTYEYEVLFLTVCRGPVTGIMGP